MNPHPVRRLRAGVLSALVVAVPVALGAAAVRLAASTGPAAVAEGDPAGVLLATAALTLGTVFAWAATAAAAGVLEAWAAVAGTAPSGGTASASRPSPTPSRGRTGIVSAGVAALVVAALTAPGAAAAAPEAPGSPAVVAEQVEDGSAEVELSPADGAAAAPPGSWSALVDVGFRAPRGACTGAAGLVAAQPSRQVPAGPGTEVVVLAGDSLWSIAESHLGPGADATEVAAAWPRWWDANRSVVGDDPNLLLPGQRLVAPPP